MPGPAPSAYTPRLVCVSVLVSRHTYRSTDNSKNSTHTAACISETAAQELHKQQTPPQTSPTETKRVFSRTLDDVPHYDTNTGKNISRYACHKMCNKKDPEMFKYLQRATKKLMVLMVFVLDLSTRVWIQHSPFMLGLDSDTCAEINPYRTPTKGICIYCSNNEPIMINLFIRYVNFMELSSW